MIALALLLLVCVGCATSPVPYPDTCTLAQPDKDGAGYTTGVMPCRLQHTTLPGQP